MSLDYCGLYAHRTPLERLERVQPLTVERNEDFALFRIERFRHKFARTVADTRAKSLGDSFFGAPETD